MTNVGVLIFWLGIIIVTGPSLENDIDRFYVFFGALITTYFITDLLKISIKDLHASYHNLVFKFLKHCEETLPEDETIEDYIEIKVENAICTGKECKTSLYIKDRITKITGNLEDGNKLLPIPHDKELTTTQKRRTRKRDKVKNLFKGGKFRRRSRKKDDDGNLIDGSVASSIGNDDQSIGSESIVTESSRLEVDQDDAHTRDVNVSVDGSLKEEEFIVVKPVPYVLLLDDVIDIRIVSFPDNDDVIANFPISVASGK